MNLKCDLDIREFLDEIAWRIDRKIEEYISRDFGEDFLAFKLKPPKYKPDLEALNKAISEPMWEFLNRGGKRWRPALFLLILEALGGGIEKYFDFAIIPELIHNGTIIADDVEDASMFRRGKPCINRLYGTDIAFNLSNALFFLPMLVLIRNKHLISIDRLNQIFEIYIQEMINLSLGQAMDIAWHKDLIDQDITEEQYFQMCIYKASSLAKMAAKIAAILAGANDEVYEKIERLAELIGISFQIQDDFLDITGKEFCKDKGGLGMDITEGKKSLLVIHTISKADPNDKKRLISILNMHTTNTELKREAICIVEKYDSVEYARNVVKKLKRESLDEIETTLSPSKAKDKLIALVNYLVERKA